MTDERFEIAAPNQLPRITTPWDYSCPLISVAYKLDSISCILSYRGIRRSYPKGPVRNLAPGAGGRGGLDAARTCPGRATDAAGPVPDGRRTPAGAGRAPDAAGRRWTQVAVSRTSPPDAAGRRQAPMRDASPDAAGRRRRPGTSGRKVPNRPPLGNARSFRRSQDARDASSGPRRARDAGRGRDAKKDARDHPGTEPTTTRRRPRDRTETRGTREASCAAYY